jgi:hypothetical protein
VSVGQSPRLIDRPAKEVGGVWVEGDPPVTGNVFEPGTVEDECSVENDPRRLA